MKLDLLNKFDEVLEIFEEVDTENREKLIEEVIELKNSIETSFRDDLISELENIKKEIYIDDIIEKIEDLINDYKNIFPEIIEYLSGLLSRLNDHYTSDDIINEIDEILMLC